MSIFIWITGILALIGLTVFIVMETVGAAIQAEIWIRLDRMQIEQDKQTSMLERILRKLGYTEKN